MSGDDAVADLEAAGRLLEQVASAGGDDPPVDATVTRVRSPHASCSRTTTSPEPSSASLTASTSTPVPVTVTTGGRNRPARCHRRPPARGRSSRSASATTSARPGPCGNRLIVTLVATLVGVGVGVAGGAGEADPHGAVEHGVAVATVVEHGDAERRLGDVDVAMGAHLELGRVPRRRGVRRAAHRAELDAARRGVGADVERERQRQQVLGVVPVELDLDVEPRRAGPQDVRQRRGRRPERSLHAHHRRPAGPRSTTSTTRRPTAARDRARTHDSRSQAS